MAMRENSPDKVHEPCMYATDVGVSSGGEVVHHRSGRAVQVSEDEGGVVDAEAVKLYSGST